MGGFKTEANNVIFENWHVNFIISHLVKCSKQMKADCMNDNNPLKNHEDKITNRLTAKYLNIGDNFFRYVPQLQEHYDEETDSYIGRIDINVISADYFKGNAEAYYIIECKRIDGTTPLNKKYITQGVERFFSPAPQPKYSSYYRQNIMFGYVVQTVVIPNNADEIDRLQGILLKGATASEFILKQSDAPQCYVYKCEYVSANIGQVELSHLFFDFADVICKK